jgi:hypothetical protein
MKVTGDQLESKQKILMTRFILLSLLPGPMFQVKMSGCTDYLGGVGEHVNAKEI